jgi:hypothetical protein
MDDIRPPDSVTTERLIDYNDTFTDLNSELNTVIEMSKNEYNLLQEQEQQSRQLKFQNIKIQISKIILFDKPNLRYYELILTIIEMFELCLINQYNIYENEYIHIFKILKSIRLPNNEIEEFKKIIIYI